MDSDKVLALAHQVGLTHYMEQHAAFDDRIYKLAALIEQALIADGWRSPEQKVIIEDTRPYVGDESRITVKMCGVWFWIPKTIYEVIRARSANE